MWEWTRKRDESKYHPVSECSVIVLHFYCQGYEKNGCCIQYFINLLTGVLYNRGQRTTDHTQCLKSSGYKATSCVGGGLSTVSHSEEGSRYGNSS
jgi:hypothetical protein